MKHKNLLLAAVVGLSLSQTPAYACYEPCGPNSANSFDVVNRWGETAFEHQGGEWSLGGRADQVLVAVSLEASGGGTLSGKIRYAGEGFIEAVATPAFANSCYSVYVTWGEGEDRTTRFDGYWKIGGRDDQAITSLQLNYVRGDYLNYLEGTCAYEGEGPIEFVGYPK